MSRFFLFFLLSSLVLPFKLYYLSLASPRVCKDNYLLPYRTYHRHRLVRSSSFGAFDGSVSSYSSCMPMGCDDLVFVVLVICGPVQIWHFVFSTSWNCRTLWAQWQQATHSVSWLISMNLLTHWSFSSNYISFFRIESPSWTLVIIILTLAVLIFRSAHMVLMAAGESNHLEV